MLKKNYRYKLLLQILDIFEERESLRAAAKAAKMRARTMGLRECLPPHFKDVMDILHQVCEEIPPQNIKNCWTKSTLVSFDPPTNNDKVVEVEDGDTTGADIGGQWR